MLCNHFLYCFNWLEMVNIYMSILRWLVVLGFNATLTAKVIIIEAVGDGREFPSFLTPVLTQLFFSKPPTTFFICF